MDKLTCPKCGNKKRFYSEVSVVGKRAVNNKGETLKRVYDIKKDNFDTEWDMIYCSICNEYINKDLVGYTRN